MGFCKVIQHTDNGKTLAVNMMQLNELKLNSRLYIILVTCCRVSSSHSHETFEYWRQVD